MCRCLKAFWRKTVWFWCERVQAMLNNLLCISNILWKNLPCHKALIDQVDKGARPHLSPIFVYLVLCSRSIHILHIIFWMDFLLRKTQAFAKVLPKILPASRKRSPCIYHHLSNKFINKPHREFIKLRHTHLWQGSPLYIPTILYIHVSHYLLKSLGCLLRFILPFFLPVFPPLISPPYLNNFFSILRRIIHYLHQN